MRRIVLLAGLTLTVGCGGGGGGGGDGAPVLPPAIPTVVSLVLAPATLTLDLEGSPDVLSVTANWSDGTVSAVNATWTLVGASNVVALGASPAPSVVVTPTAIGAVTVRAMFGGKMAQAPVTVDWGVPADPGLYYGIEIDGLGIGSGAEGPGVVEYSGAPGETPRSVVQDPMFWNVVGSSMSRDGSRVFVSVQGAIHAVDVSTGAISPLGALPGTAAFGLVTTEDGKLVTYADTGTLWKLDPVSGVWSPLGTESGYPFALALGPAGALYSYNLLSGSVERRVLGASDSSAPSTFATGVPLMGNGGLCANRAGEVLYIALASSDVRRFVDLNGDGDALDPGEDTPFATLPYVWNVDSLSFVQSMIPGGGRSVLLNMVPLSDFDPAYDGIWWARDVDGDGVAESVARHTPAHVDTFEMWSLTSTR